MLNSLLATFTHAHGHVSRANKAREGRWTGVHSLVGLVQRDGANEAGGGGGGADEVQEGGGCH